MDLANKAKNFWSNGFAAKLYRKNAGRHYAKMHEAVAGEILARQAKDVLDIACGPGDFLFLLSEQAPDMKLTGTDIAPGMVSHASTKLGSRASILEASAERQPFSPASFDAVTIMLAFHHFPDKSLVLKNAAELLRPGGVLIVADLIATNSFEKHFWNVLERFISIRGYIGHYTQTEISGWARGAGLAATFRQIPQMANRYRLCIMVRQ